MPTRPSRSRAPRPLLALAALAVLLVAAAAAPAAPRTLGWLEWAWLEPDHVELKAKLDTGARTSSIHAEDIEPFERDGAPWVRFRVPLSERPDDAPQGRDVVYERPVVREALIKRHRRESLRRYVVELELCIAGTAFTTPMTLADRSRFNYPLLLGRIALEGRIAVDPARKFTAEDACPATAPE